MMYELAMKQAENDSHDKSETANINSRIENLKQKISSSKQYQASRQEMLGRIALPFPGLIRIDTADIKRAPYESAGLVTSLNLGYPVSVQARKAQGYGSWYYIKTTEGIEGWLKSEQISFTTSRRLTDIEIKNRKYKLPVRAVTQKPRTGGNIIMYDAPSLQSSQKNESLDYGTKITVLEIFSDEATDWYRIRTRDYNEGWILSKYVKIESSL